MQRIYFNPLWLNSLILTGRPNLNEFYSPNNDTVILFKKLGLQQQQDTTLHHILPGNLIIDMMQNCRRQKHQTQLQRTCDVLANHCTNHPTIYTRVQNYISQKDWVSAIDTCWSTIFWFKNNLVLGPNENKRSNDPGNKIDEELLKNQSNNYQKIMYQVRDALHNKKWNDALKYFLTLPPTNNIIWKLNQKSNKWQEKGKSNLQGNAGFTY